MDYKILIEGKIKEDTVISNLKGNYFFRNVVDFLSDSIDYIKIKVDKKNKNGYFITIIQNDLESKDIVDYFARKFKTKFSNTEKTKNKIIFKGYDSTRNKEGKDISRITFYYRFNLFEKKQYI